MSRPTPAARIREKAKTAKEKAKTATLEALVREGIDCDDPASHFAWVLRALDVLGDPAPAFPDPWAIWLPYSDSAVPLDVDAVVVTLPADWTGGQVGVCIRPDEPTGFDVIIRPESWASWRSIEMAGGSYEVRPWAQ